MGRNSKPHTLFPTLQMGRKNELHSFSPSVRWKFESEPHTLFPHCNKMGKKSVPPTLFFPIIEGEKVQRVKVYPYPAPRWALIWANFDPKQEIGPKVRDGCSFPRLCHYNMSIPSYFRETPNSWCVTTEIESWRTQVQCQVGQGNYTG